MAFSTVGILRLRLISALRRKDLSPLRMTTVVEIRVDPRESVAMKFFLRVLSVLGGESL